MYPTSLDKIINLFESLPEDERRETLVSYADNAKRQEPREGENFDLVDVRKDEECTDTVGDYLQGARRLNAAGDSGSAERFCDARCGHRTGASPQPDRVLRPHADKKHL